ncbi:hypothetical protein [Aliivibrio kagoshimensis]|uniref:hypothetical protein n=1 Tax=Aliivibrio kagoshimensis TaxID=2910230 RepID=UPI003D10C2F8
MTASDSNQDHKESLINTIWNYLLLLAGPLLLLASFSAYHWFFYDLSQWLIVSVGFIGIFLCLINLQWKFTLGLFTLLAIVFSYLPREAIPQSLSLERVASPVIGDYYPMDVFDMQMVKAPDEFPFVIHRVKSFDEMSITFHVSTKRFSQEGVDQLLDPTHKKVQKIFYLRETRTFSKKDLSTELRLLNIANVTRFAHEAERSIYCCIDRK